MSEEVKEWIEAVKGSDFTLAQLLLAMDQDEMEAEDQIEVLTACSEFLLA